MDVSDVPGFDVGEATGVMGLKTGVVATCVEKGTSPPRGVDACRVANKSGVGDTPERPKLHDRMTNSVAVIQMNFFLFVIQFD